MAKHSRVWNREKYEEYIREGRGQGTGLEYKAWIRIQNFASHGVVSRIKGRKTNRVHDLMSNNELAYFYLLDWSDKVLDIREQYPLLDLDTAIEVASWAGIKYPADKISAFPYVLTCDFMITTEEGLKARTIKMASELNQERVLEKLEIERRYWTVHGVDWKIVTENEISYVKAKNIEWLYSAQNFGANEYISGVMTEMVEMFKSGRYSIIETAQKVEEKFLLSRGTGLFLFKHLALNKTISFDLNAKLDLNMMKVSVII